MTLGMVCSWLDTFLHVAPVMVPFGRGRRLGCSENNFRISPRRADEKVDAAWPTWHSIFWERLSDSRERDMASIHGVEEPVRYVAHQVLSIPFNTKYLTIRMQDPYSR